jgi:lysophospholipase L1-like esterase
MKYTRFASGCLLAALGLLAACSDAAAPPYGSGDSGAQSGPFDARGAPEAAGQPDGALAIDGLTFPGEAGAPWRIMPLGDSITATTCYPKLLAQKLNDNGRTHFTFIGSVLNNQSCWSAPNVQTEGHGYYLVTYLTTDSPPEYGKGKQSELLTWAATKPDVVLMQYGTNDVWNHVATNTILDAYSFVLDAFRQQNPNVIFFVAQIPPLNPSGCADCEANVEALNAAMPAWAASQNTASSPVFVVDIWSSLAPASGYVPKSTDTADGCHPTPAGSQKMADKWYEALLATGIP